MRGSRAMTKPFGTIIGAPPRLPQRLAALNPHVESAYQGRRRIGDLPAIAPKLVLQAPLWSDAKSAAKASHLKRTYRDVISGAVPTLVLETVNVLPITTDGSECSGGLLRYLDLDVVMALSLAWMRSETRDVELEQREFFRLMGYHDLGNAPYTELRSSLRRLCNTSIVIYQAGSSARDSTTWKLVEWHGQEQMASAGSPVLIQASLSHLWEQTLSSLDEWQLVDLNAYAALARHDRRNGLARILYLFLASWRRHDGTFDVPLRTVLERYGDRRPNGYLRGTNISSPSHRLHRALRALHGAGVVDLGDLPEGERFSTARLRGTFKPAQPLAVLVPPRQQIQFRPSLWNSEAIERVAAAEPPTSIIAPSDWGSLVAKTIETTLPRLVRFLSPRPPKTLFEEATRLGWTKKQQWLLVSYVLWRSKTVGDIHNPAGFLATIIAQGGDDPDFRANYSADRIQHLVGEPYETWSEWIWRGPLRGIERPRRPTEEPVHG
jgi:hypothetical protein